mmetsp:Transcript_19232/g.44205  ORF Transcript_19232/g.44205 Transcript_19232/m.44205 type:complete len:341 (-) Transcript_19232:346-1368(-)|eukprot:CAMPEP_0119358160 /NCGR_PEP_ID=MMETSP1334-20130426/6422_1 /TAXON_ID=127549 /ORGANISM="Calcidiscus leptoporus, Strain RCC1130" /LENGTH=340 /DNA_ID=CAMNT_0007372589 /DNA_START=35 /DNA_END=1057 /DNA_ORIENTATION=-
MICVRLPSGRTRALEVGDGLSTVEHLHARLSELEAIPLAEQRVACGGRPLAPHVPLLPLMHCTFVLSLRVCGGGGDGDHPDWTEAGRVKTTSGKKRGPDARAPDWHADPAKYAAKIERDKRDRGELVVAIGPFCVPCGKRFAKQTVYDAHLSGSKHLKALERLGRTEEASVCRIDVEANKRKFAAIEAARTAERNPGAVAATPVPAMDEEEKNRRAAREEKLRQRAMMPMPSTVAASSVYVDETDGGTASESAPGTESSNAHETDTAILAAAAAGVESTYGKGQQDAADRQNRFTTADKAAAHRSLAVAPADWFGNGIHAAAAEPELPTEARVAPQPKSM